MNEYRFDVGQRSRKWQLGRSAFLVLVLACGLMTILASQPPQSVDVPASDLDVEIAVIDTDPYPSDGKVVVTMTFLQDGRAVELRGGATVTCNGQSLPWQTVAYMARVPIVSVGGNYNFAHTRGAVTTNVAITVPPRPVILSPAGGAALPRSNNVTITYVPGTADEVSGRARGHRAGAGTISVTAGDQDDNGMYSGLDVTSTGGAGTFDPGPGALSITRKLSWSPSSTGFNSVEVQYSSSAEVNITWS